MMGDCSLEVAFSNEEAYKQAGEYFIEENRLYTILRAVSLLSIVQMPGGIPVATVAINQAKNAALLAIQMLAITDEKLAKKLENYKIEMRDKVLNAKLED